VGTYAYPAQGPSAIRPHAIQSIPGVGTGNFGYDTNGNLTSIPGVMTAAWTSYDMPQSITKSGSTSTFTYGPEHQRIKQIRSDGRTVIYAGAQEIENNSGQVTVKTYWPYGVGVEIDKPATATELNWMHVDRLGSPIAISDNIGNLRERLAYDAWGKRRTLNGAPINSTATPNSIDGITDNRGFTGHEMLDLLDLVHMNGRVYDPLLGKFLSADPLIQDPMNGQSYNRYSYVLNNPTNLTDPTGFACAAKTGSNIPESDCEEKRAENWAKGFDKLGKQEQAKVIAEVGLGTVNKILTIAGVQKIDAKNLGAAGAFDMMRKIDGELTNRLEALPNIPAGEKAAYGERLNSLNEIRSTYLEAGATLGQEVDRAGGLMFSLGIQIGTAKNVLGNNAAGMLEIGAAAVAMGMSGGAKQSEGGGSIRIRHYTSNKGLKGIKEDEIIKASDQNTVFAERARGKPLSKIDAQDTYGLKPGHGQNYIETDVPAHRVNKVYNPTTKNFELQIKGDVPLENAKFFKR
jgi:RHS repeat-associated protein